MDEVSRSCGETQSLCQQLFLASLEKIKARNKMSWEQLEKTENRRDLHDDISIITVDLEKLQ